MTVGDPLLIPGYEGPYVRACNQVTNAFDRLVEHPGDRRAKRGLMRVSPVDVSRAEWGKVRLLVDGEPLTPEWLQRTLLSFRGPR